MEKLRIVFMGTPDFAVGILSSILQNNYDIVGVITAADKPAGRGQKVKFSAVKEFAIENNLRLLQPTNLKDPEFLTELASLEANLQVVVAFRMLPEAVWRMPKYGTFNLHASLLPQYRGAAPINWSIINGETMTGVTTFFIDDKIDTGEIILSSEVGIMPNEDAGSLHDRLMAEGSILVNRTLELISRGSVSTMRQVDNDEIKTAYKLNRENCRIDWNKPVSAIHNLIRGLSPYPAAWTQLCDNQSESDIKIFDAQPVIEEHNFSVGHIASSKKQILIYGIDGYLKINALQMPGKRKMTTSELLNGVSFSDSAVAR